jgi:hypothetical protein
MSPRWGGARGFRSLRLWAVNKGIAGQAFLVARASNVPGAPEGMKVDQKGKRLLDRP